MIPRSNRHFRFSPWPIVLPLCAIVMAVAVFVVTQNVQRREAHVGELNRQLLSEQQTLRVLDAEWAYLTRPQRLEELMAMKTDSDVMPPVPTPVANVVPAEPAVEPAADVVAQAEPAAGEVEKPAVAEAPKKAVKIVEDKPIVKKASAPKKVAVKAVPKTQKIAAAKKDLEGAWHITPKKTYVPQRTASLPMRGGIARPIVE